MKVLFFRDTSVFPIQLPFRKRRKLLRGVVDIVVVAVAAIVVDTVYVVF